MALYHVYNQTVGDGTATSVVRPSDWNSAHSQMLTLSGNTVGASTVSGTNIVFQGGNNVTLSANQGANAGTIVISGAAGGGGGAVTVGGAEIFPLGNNSVFSTYGQNSIYFQKFINHSNVSFNNIERRVSMSSVSSAIAANANYTIDYGIYARLDGESTSQYSLQASSQLIMRASYSSNLSAGWTVSQGAASVTNTSAGTVNMSAVTGFKHIYMPYTSTLTAGGNYAVAMRVSSATTGNTGALRIGFKELTNYSTITVGRVDVVAGISITNASRVGDFAQGVYSATSSNLPNTLGISGLTNAVNQAKMYVQFEV